MGAVEAIGGMRIILSDDPTIAVTGRGNDPVTPQRVFGTIRPTLDEFLVVRRQRARVVRWHVLIGVPKVPGVLGDGLHADAMATETSVAFNVNRPHIPVRGSTT